MASRPRRAPRRRLPGEIDVMSDLAFVNEVSKMAVSGELACMDAIRLISDSVVARDPMRIAEWAFKKLVVPAGKSSRPGPMMLTAMQAAIADIIQMPEVRQVTYLKGPQIGFSFLIAAVLLYFAAHENRPTMFYDRALKNAKSFYEEKWEAIFRASDEISHLLPEERSSLDRQRWTDRTLTTGPGARFRSVSDKIKSDTATVLAGDEGGDSAYQNRGKNSEGSKVGLLRARVIDQPDNKFLFGGTPTAKGESAVTDEWNRSNKCEWVMTFSCCGVEAFAVDDVREVLPDQAHVPHGPGLRYVRNEKGHCGEIWYECQGCAAHIPPTEKVPLLGTGRWVPQAEGEPGHWGVRSWMFHSQSPEGTWRHIGDAHIAAVESPDKMQSFTNLWLAREWTPPVARMISVADLREKVLDPGAFDVPMGIEFLFAGIDAQRGSDVDPDKPPRMEIVIYGVGANLRRHVIGHFVISKRHVRDSASGETVAVSILPFSRDAEIQVAAVLDREFVRQDGKKLKVLRSCCDVSYEMEQATEFVRRINGDMRRVMPVRGMSEASGRAPSIGRWDPRQPVPAQCFVFKNGMLVHKLGTQSIKDHLFETLSLPTPGPQSWSFPPDMSDHFYLDLLAEHLVEKPSGRIVWARKDREVTGEVWDCLVYAMAAEFMEREWTRFGSEKMIPAIRISREAIEDAIAVEAAKILSEKAVKVLPAATSPAVAPVPQDVDEASSKRDEPQFEIIRDASEPVIDDASPISRPHGGFVRAGGW